MGFAEKRRAFWIRKERKYNVAFPMPFRDRLVTDFEWELSMGRPIAQELHARYLKKLDIRLSDFMDMMALLTERQEGRPSNRKPPIVRNSSQRRYGKCLERRKYLVSFVIDKKGGVSKRANWKQITNDWNKANPSDKMNSLVLKAEYYRALKEDPGIITP